MEQVHVSKTAPGRADCVGGMQDSVSPVETEHSSLADGQRHQVPNHPQLAVPLPDGLPQKASGLELEAP